MSAIDFPTVEVTSENYNLISKRAIKQVLSICESSGWEKNSSEMGVEKYLLKQNDNPIPAFKGIGTIDCEAIILMHCVSQSEYRPDLDEIFDKSELIQEFNSNCRVERFLYKAPFIVSKRDFIVLGDRCKVTNFQGHPVVYVGAAKSVLHSEGGEVDKYLRGEINIGGWIIIPNENNTQCQVIYTGQTDIKGSIPDFLKSKMGDKQPLQIANLKKMVENEDYTSKKVFYGHVEKNLPTYSYQEIMNVQ